jgi:nucleotide-binding universal stress UspA family protein
MTEPSPAEKSRDRVFLVVVDESQELKVALRYASIRARKTGGRVAMLAVVEPAEAQDWMGVNELMREEARMAAEQTLQKLAADVQKTSNAMPILIVREGNRRDELLKLIDEEPSISILVLRPNDQIRRQAPDPHHPGPRQPVP